MADEMAAAPGTRAPNYNGHSLSDACNLDTGCGRDRNASGYAHSCSRFSGLSVTDGNPERGLVRRATCDEHPGDRRGYTREQL